MLKLDEEKIAYYMVEDYCRAHHKTENKPPTKHEQPDNPSQLGCTLQDGVEGESTLRIHPQTKLCNECLKLFEYAVGKMKACRFQPSKPVCSTCSIHCYEPKMRRKIRAVMRFAGPRMIFRHPWTAFLYILKKRADCKRIPNSRN